MTDQGALSGAIHLSLTPYMLGSRAAPSPRGWEAVQLLRLSTIRLTIYPQMGWIRLHLRGSFAVNVLLVSAANSVVADDQGSG